MAAVVYSLRGVPEDEAQELRDLLGSHGIAFHETTGGLFGLGTPALWVIDEADLARARSLIDDYQRQRAHTQRSEYERQRTTGEQRRIAHMLREEPLKLLLYVAAVLAVLYLTVVPFWKLIR